MIWIYHAFCEYFSSVKYITLIPFNSPFYCNNLNASLDDLPSDKRPCLSGSIFAVISDSMIQKRTNNKMDQHQHICLPIRCFMVFFSISARERLAEQKTNEVRSRPFHVVFQQCSIRALGDSNAMEVHAMTDPLVTPCCLKSKRCGYQAMFENQRWTYLHRLVTRPLMGTSRRTPTFPVPMREKSADPYCDGKRHDEWNSFGTDLLIWRYIFPLVMALVRSNLWRALSSQCLISTQFRGSRLPLKTDDPDHICSTHYILLWYSWWRVLCKVNLPVSRGSSLGCNEFPASRQRMLHIPCSYCQNGDYVANRRRLRHRFYFR